MKQGAVKPFPVPPVSLGLERDTVVEILQLIDVGGDAAALMRKVVVILRAWSGCEAVAVRLRTGLDFPYVAATGFSQEFLDRENRLCAVDDMGRLLRDDGGNVLLECMCGTVLTSRTDPAEAFFTEKGSFYTNGSTALLAGTRETDRGGRKRNRCNRAGYESVALVPIRLEGYTYGLFQCNDRRPGRFDEETIARLERLAEGVGHLLRFQRL